MTSNVGRLEGSLLKHNLAIDAKIGGVRGLGSAGTISVSLMAIPTGIEQILASTI